ncbi:ABC transporter ATP-binding protein [Enterocloster lavalensis]|uniref:Peptide/nickel transport system ATP-binding protein n=1 Tax=Enterocloster lavalensis TaxID=460384 RepID=A0A1I0DGL0_9FIRM|nr:ABC transporter ATP-binding protein [Enterocloster lavalensis]MBS5603367.1 ABC transporter ATP-binding protein [Enterocloster asparagiformis]PST35180.1 ABC transporter ATP-binding protein [Enterocloster lavalensis]SET31222.1 peptide/nickel transport system ATP-binding protein [Enterocloster lavalensis]
MEHLLEIKNLTIRFDTNDGSVQAVNGIDLNMHGGETLGLVGETGAGKTTLAKGIMRLTPCPPGKIVSGEILFEGRDLLKMSDNEIRQIRGKHISMIFQDPMTSLNPVMTVGAQIAEVIATHEHLSEGEARKKAESMLEMVGITKERYGEYPHQFSGGMKQRVIIAIALACNPQLLIADEPTTALDVTIQAQVLEMMRELKNKQNTAMLLITHDLGIVAQNCDYTAIVYAGKIIEYGSVLEVFKKHLHPYTEGLLGSIPNMAVDVKRLTPIEGLMPDPTRLPEGCAFHPRCQYACKRCALEAPEPVQISETHYVRCWRQHEEVKQ